MIIVSVIPMQMIWICGTLEHNILIYLWVRLAVLRHVLSIVWLVDLLWLWIIVWVLLIDGQSNVVVVVNGDRFDDLLLVLGKLHLFAQLALSVPVI
jgi:hypothetical protein